MSQPRKGYRPATICKCGHAKSQHNRNGKVCDYAGYACNCTGYERETPPLKKTGSNSVSNPDNEILRLANDKLCKIRGIDPKHNHLFGEITWELARMQVQAAIK